MITLIETERVADVIDLSTALQQEHWEEIARNKHLMVLAPDVEKYRAIERAGKLFAVLAYDGDEMVGYSVNILDRNLHYRDLVQAQNDVLFVKQSHRAGRLFMRLRDATLRMAKDRGARLMLWHAKQETPLAEILPRLGCKVQDIIYSEELPASSFRMFGSFPMEAGTYVAEAALQEAVASDLWDVFTARQDAPGSPHHDTRTIVLRGPVGDMLTNDVIFNELEAVDTNAVEHLPAVAALCRAACDRLQVKELGRVMLVELAPGGHIDRHFDDGAYAAYYERFHLVLQSDVGNTFTCGTETIHMQPGELWQFDHRTEHEVRNASARPRIHLIIDATV
jgi:quercetin dioxygenase-like cupin family protein